MNDYKYLFLFIFLCLVSCQNNSKVDILSQELAMTRDSFSQLKNQVRSSSSGKLQHLVFFDTKTEVASLELMDSLKMLYQIQDVKRMELGQYKSQSDSRAMSDYEVGMKILFDNEQAYARYQLHPIHKSLKQNTKHLMAGPPKTYHYIIK